MIALLRVLLLQLNLVGAVNINWSGITDPIGELFLGSDSLDGIIGDNQMVAGLFLFAILFIFTLVMGLGMLIGSVVIIPSLFAVFQYIPSLQMLVAIICGLVFGFGLNRVVRR